MSAKSIAKNPDALKALQRALQKFAAERDWDQFHSPKNLAAAISVEAAELLEHFQWLTEEDSQRPSGDRLGEISEEMADVMLYLLRLADKLDVDLISACASKIELNGRKYPVAKSRGNSKKYSKL